MGNKQVKAKKRRSESADVHRTQTFTQLEQRKSSTPQVPLVASRSSSKQSVSHSMGTPPLERSTQDALAQRQKALIRKCWGNVMLKGRSQSVAAIGSARTTPASFGERVMCRAITRHLELRSLFGWSRASMQNTRECMQNEEFLAHAKAIDTTMTMVLQQLDDMHNNLRLNLFDLGCKHAQYVAARGKRVQPIEWDYFSDAMLKTVVESRAGGRHPQGLTAAWRVLTQWMITVIRDGYLTGQFAMKMHAREQRRASAPLLQFAQLNNFGRKYSFGESFPFPEIDRIKECSSALAACHIPEEEAMSEDTLGREKYIDMQREAETIKLADVKL